ncbi:hypothetical protein PS914_03972 [Pseudomonas fluorescens]|nr:hypothetical protein PS914_03972 [Pseudomonas fluorescens]
MSELSPVEKSGAPPEVAVSMKKVAVASVIGTTVEWYDLFVFATASALVFNKVFFPDFDPLIGTLLAFGTFASAYLARLSARHCSVISVTAWDASRCCWFHC